MSTAKIVSTFAFVVAVIFMIGAVQSSGSILDTWHIDFDEVNNDGDDSRKFLAILPSCQSLLKTKPDLSLIRRGQ